jgi:hypothetical protein
MHDNFDRDAAPNIDRFDRSSLVSITLTILAVLALVIGIVALVGNQPQRNVFCNISGSIGS